MVLQQIASHGRITVALMMREIMTRFGREGLGFVWLIGEPLIFCAGVIAMWTLLKPAYEHGIRVGAFVMTGYMCLVLMRHTISYSINAVQANIGLLYHRKVTIIHILASRCLLELCGSSLAFIVVYSALYIFGWVALPHDLGLIYLGWFSLFWFSTGLGVVLSALSTEYEVIERIVGVFMYLLIPISGVFVMVAWLPPHYRDLYLLVPIPNSVEMVRAGVFGEFVPTYFHAWYPVAWGTLLNLLGLLLFARARKHIHID